MFLGRARMELPKDGTTWRWLFPWEGETCWNFVREKAKVEEMLGQGGCAHAAPGHRDSKTAQPLVGVLPTEKNPPDDALKALQLLQASPTPVQPPKAMR